MTDLPSGLAFRIYGLGARDDWQIFRARKQHGCYHMGPHSRPIVDPMPCPGFIEPGEIYLRTRQGWQDYAPLKLTCAIAAGFVVEAPEE